MAYIYLNTENSVTDCMSNFAYCWDPSPKFKLELCNGKSRCKPKKLINAFNSIFVTDTVRRCVRFDQVKTGNARKR
jgi:hypothetical protein